MKLFYLLIVFFLHSSFSFPDYPFYNTSLPWDVRVDDLVSRLTLQELQEQLARGTGGAPAIPRLGIKQWEWWTECLNGDVNNNATSFPATLGLGASFAPDLVGAVAHAIASEVRAKYTQFRSEGKYNVYQGVSCLSPMLNIMRDGRWGRCEETYGEDPMLSGLMSKHVVEGLQGDHPRYLLVSSGCKSFDAYAGPEKNRLAFDAKISTRDFRTTFLPAFRTCVESGTYNVMCSYNSINGIPSCVNSGLLNGVLRKEWGFKGYVISDAGAIEHIITGHKYFNSSVDTVTASLKAGCNLELADEGKTTGLVFQSIVQAVKEGKLDESFVRNMSKPLWYTRMRLGDFDPESMNPYSGIPISIVQSKSHRSLAELAAMQSIVLLKNDGGFLPLQGKTFNKVAIVGPLANNSRAQISNYSPLVDPKYTSTPLSGLVKLGKEITFGAGCVDGTSCRQYEGNIIINAVRDADLVFVCLGLGDDVEMEGMDRPNISLPGYQQQLLEDVANYIPPTSNTVLILFNAGPVDLNWADNSTKITSIIEAFYPAQSTGTALFNVITNNKPYGLANPAARLPFTWLKHDNQIPPINDYSMKERTYKYFTSEPLYPFGYGLSYTSFRYSNLTMDISILASEPVYGSLTIHNIGNLYGDEVLQVYISWLDSPYPTPRLSLVSFSRISIAPGKYNPAFFTITAKDMAVWREDDTGWQIFPGRYNVYVGGQQPHQSKTINSNVLTKQFIVSGTKFLGKY
ncbi:hypothetical protein LOTGIDRAFT_157123 [Lottia gigantea]|uniref:Fibronectin type III-like domain-containing protein n=1 Tax=Lottia gigantea TaxID=225164 RepID=V4B8D2_LOTGI|nr:hypothetical protein LOTGIDRAFT_157123 [Lottia gigantea]ESP01987.1 hypothetical protein LOTGIDRAFT_157123 [Lottia gigantea]